MGQKRGQITVYIILGIIALVSVSIFFYTRSVKVEAPVSYKPTLEQIPVEAEPIRQFVASCVTQTAEDGLKKIGDYGGYTSSENMKASFNPVFPTESEAVQFSPGSDLRVPYWFYMSGPNNCEKSGSCSFSSKRPKLYRTEGGTNIEEQLDDYVNSNIKSCLRDFIDLQNYGFAISEAGPVRTRTIITQNSVAFHVNYPLIAEKAGVSYQINEYLVDIPLNLKEIYELASNVTNAEIEHSFLEKYIKNTISIFSDVDEDMLPPASGVGMDSGGGVSWTKSEVKTQLMQILSSYISMLQLPNTRNYRPIQFPEGTRHRDAKITLYNNAMLIPFFDPHPNLESTFSYLDWWNPYFELNCKGEMCGPEAVSGLGTLTFFLQRYHFNYDVSLPVLVNIVNPFAFNGKGYSFKFFLEANLRDNDPVQENQTGALEPVNLGGNSLLCEPNQRNSKEITVETLDNFIGYGVEGVMVSYECGTENCYMGQTDENGKFTASFPMCAGGTVKLFKEGYLGTGAFLSTSNLIEPLSVKIQMNPIKEKDVVVKRYRVNKICIPIPVDADTGSLAANAATGGVSGSLEDTAGMIEGDSSSSTSAMTGGASRTQEDMGGGFVLSCGWVFNQNPMPLTNYEEATVIMSRRGEPWEDPFVAVAEYTGNLSDEDGSKGMRIIPGNYDITINTALKEAFYIPEDERCEGGFAGVGETCETMKRVDFDNERPFASGGATLLNVPIHAGEIESSDKIVLYAVTFAIEDIPLSYRKHEDLQKATEAGAYSNSYRSLLLPRYEQYTDEERQRQNRTVTLT